MAKLQLYLQSYTRALYKYDIHNSSLFARELTDQSIP